MDHTLELETKYASKNERKKNKQAGAKLGQAQTKLRWDFALIFCRFGLVGMVLNNSSILLVDYIQFCKFD